MQLLNQTVSLFPFSLKCDGPDLFRIMRCYQFEFCEDGTDRFTDYVDLIGRRIVSIKTQGQDGETIYYQKILIVNC